MNTKVLSAEKRDGKVYLEAEAAKGGKPETVGSIFPYHQDVRLTRK
jgi:hypothetical protein